MDCSQETAGGKDDGTNNGIPAAAGVIYQNGDNTTSPQGLVELFQKRSENIWGSWIWDHRDH